MCNKQENLFKNSFLCWRLEGQGRKKQDPAPDPDSLVRGTDPRIRIRTKMSQIHNTVSSSKIQSNKGL
jgi:hypothetical protein